MKRTFKYYAAIWAVLFALFNVIAFVSVGWIEYEKYTPSFAVGYIFITLSFIGQLVCTCIAFRDNNLRKTFYKLSLVRISYTGLILSFIFGGLCMLISPLPYWIGAIVCSILLVFNIIALIKASIAIDLVSATDCKIKAKTEFVKLLTVDAEALAAKAKSDEAKAACKKVYEAIRYSDPMSSSALAEIESKIKEKFAAFAAVVESNDIDAVNVAAAELAQLVDERNKKCKVMK